MTAGADDRPTPAVFLLGSREVRLTWERGGAVYERPLCGTWAWDMRTTARGAPSERHCRMTLGRDARRTQDRSASPRVYAADGVRVRQHAVTHRGTVTGRAHQPPQRTKHTAARPSHHAPPPAFRQMVCPFAALARRSFRRLCSSLPRCETRGAGREQLSGSGRGTAATGAGECQGVGWDERARSAERGCPVSPRPEWPNTPAVIEPDAVAQWPRKRSRRRQLRL